MADGALELFLPGDVGTTAPDLRPMIVDSFAGGGGASTGIEMALGRSPDVAINHDAAALSMHRVNHPETLHLTTSINAVDPSDVVPPGRRVGLAWFSPDCKHHSKAKGGKPLDKNIRDLAWVVVHWAERVAPEVILLENVEEFQDWGPLRQRHEGGRKTTAGPLSHEEWDSAPPEIKGTPVFKKDDTPWMEPCPFRRGQTFNRWVTRLRRLGYKVAWRELRACDYGAPTIRKRLFVVARRDGHRIVWPEPTHGKPATPAVIKGDRKPWRTAAEIIDWSLPCPSIFDTSDEIMEKHGLRAIRPLADGTLKRIARGVKRYVIDCAEPFVVTCNHSGEGFRGQGLSEPMKTVTAARDAHGLVVPTVAPFATYGQHGGANRSIEDPHHTITASKKDQNAIVVPTIAPFVAGVGGRMGQSPERGADQPFQTFTTKGDAAIVTPHLISVAHGYSGGRREYPMTDPIGTMTGAGAQHALVAASMMSMHGKDRRDASAETPVNTVTAGGNHAALIAAFLAQHNTGAVGRHADAPLSTLTTRATQQNVVAAHLMTMRNAGKPFQGADEPTHTITAGGAHMFKVAAFLQKYYGQGVGQEMTDPLHTLSTRDTFGLVVVVIAGEPYVIVDIGMRMLTPREMFRAQGFPDGFEIDTGHDGRRFTKTEQTRMCGNSVCPPLAAALARANCPDLICLERAQ